MSSLATLPSIIFEIRAEHDLAQASAQDAVAHAIKAGQLLLVAKEQTPYGLFGKWIADNFAFSQRTARDYMRVAKAPAEKQIGRASAKVSIAGIVRATRRPKTVMTSDHKPAAAKRNRQPTLSDREYRALRQKLINSVIARVVPSVKRASETLLGTDELMQLREAICAVVDQYISRADTPTKNERAHLVIIDKETAA